MDDFTARRNEIARLLYDHRQTPGGTLTDEARRWLERERQHYNGGGDLDTWPEARGRIEAAEALAEARSAEAQAAQDEARVAAEAKAAEAEAALRARIAAEVDPVTQWRRAHAARTF